MKRIENVKRVFSFQTHRSKCRIHQNGPKMTHWAVHQFYLKFKKLFSTFFIPFSHRSKIKDHLSDHWWIIKVRIVLKS